MSDPLKGRILTNATSITLANNTAYTEDVIVPSGKRWLLLFMSITNPDDVTRNVNVDLYADLAKSIKLARIGYKSAMEASAAQRYVIPSFLSTVIASTSMNFVFPLLLDAGMTISVIWDAGGVSTGGTDADGLIVYVVEYDL